MKVLNKFIAGTIVVVGMPLVFGAIMKYYKITKHILDYWFPNFGETSFRGGLNDVISGVCVLVTIMFIFIIIEE